MLKEYKYLKPYYGSNYKIPLEQLSNLSHACPLIKDYVPLLSRPQKFSGVRPTEHNVWKSIYKMDEPTGINVKFPDLWQRAREMTENQLSFCLSVYPNLNPFLVPNTSPGVPFSQMGFKRKDQVLCCPDFWREYVDNPFDKIALWRVSPKHEFLPLEEIVNEGKIRTFIIPPLHLLYWQKVFGCGDENIKKLYPGDIRYGYTFQYGGFDRLIKQHGGGSFRKTMRRVFWEVDVSGYDRRFPLMEIVWDIRKKFFKLPVHLRPFFVWMVNNTIRSFILLPNGDIVIKDWGNNSGSGTTTSDNCIGHQLINNYFRMLMQRKMDFALDDIYSDLYGDDLLSSVDLHRLPDKEKIFVRKLYVWMAKTYKEFNLTLKESSFKVQIGPIGMHFLGATCQKWLDNFIPSYDSNRIYSALMFEIKKHTTDQEIMKAYALMHLAWHDEELFDYIALFLNNVLADEKIDSSNVRTLRRLGLPERGQVISQFWLGREGCYDFLPPELESVDINMTLEVEALKRNPLEPQGCKEFFEQFNINGERMLNKKQFEKKHAAKFRNLSAAAKTKRYDDYARAFKSNGTRGRSAKMGREPKGPNSTINPGGGIRSRATDQIRTDEVGMPLRYGRKGRKTIKTNNEGAIRLSGCGKLYISGLLVPFQFVDGTSAKLNRGLGMSGDIPEELPCVPTFPSIKSRRHKIFIRTSATTGSFTTFQVAFAPRRISNDYPTAFGDFPPLIVTNGSGDPGLAFSDELDIRGGTLNPAFTSYNWNSDYTVAAITPLNTIRVVCAGVRIRYAGSEINQSGIVHAVEEPNHYTLNAASLAYVSNYESYFRCPVSKKWCTLTYNPVDPEEYEYQQDAAEDPATVGNLLAYRMNHHYMGFIVQGVAAQSLFEVEAVAIIEVVGANIRDLKQATSDMRSIELAGNHINPANQQVQNDSPKSLITTIKDSAQDFTQIIAPSARFMDYSL